MPRAALLNKEEIDIEMFSLPFWKLNTNSIERELVASNFAMAVGIVNSIAVLAESMNHHPDILIYGWNKIRITLSTHDAGGLTELDFKLAGKIDELKF